jgi:CubicO group peptidase (beta-lactamase class C family)
MRIVVCLLASAAAALIASGTAQSASPNAATGKKPDFAGAAKVLRDAVADRAFPGCVAAVGTRDEVLWLAPVGNLAYEDAEKTGGESGGGNAAEVNRVTADTMYDLASLTKVVGTTAVVACLIRDGKMARTDALEKFIPEFVSSAPEADRAVRRSVTIDHLLTHSTGLPAGRPLYQAAHTYKDVIAAAAKVRLEAPPGKQMVYSDLGFILLGEAASRAGGKPLAELERTLVFEPIGMKSTRRTPTKDLWPRVAPTERKPRGETIGGATGEFIRGVVHDENARGGEGLTGHAGLFSTAGDLALLAQEWLRALDGKSQVFPQSIAKEFTTRRNLVAGSSRALGWDTPSGRSSAGSKMPKAFGHTGFTGTSIWIDPDRGVYVILLANRVHPTRQNQKIAAVRRNLADAAISAIDAARGTTK